MRQAASFCLSVVNDSPNSRVPFCYRLKDIPIERFAIAPAASPLLAAIRRASSLVSSLIVYCGLAAGTWTA
jgi:hypothetical protein